MDPDVGTNVSICCPTFVRGRYRENHVADSPFSSPAGILESSPSTSSPSVQRHASHGAAWHFAKVFYQVAKRSPAVHFMSLWSIAQMPVAPQVVSTEDWRRPLWKERDTAWANCWHRPASFCPARSSTSGERHADSSADLGRNYLRRLRNQVGKSLFDARRIR